MSVENAKKFLADVKADKSLEAKIDKGNKAASQDEKLAGIASAAKAEGYDFTADELKEAALAEAELSVEEFAAVDLRGGRCKAFGAGDCVCFGDGGHCTCFGDNCIAFFT